MVKLNIAHTIVVEGRYDRAKLEGIVNARIITTNGFGLFSHRDRLSLLQKIAARGKIILLCDSDGGGTQIRSFITRSLPKDSVIQLYTPQVYGKEKRKAAPSKAGILGVEGTDTDVLRRLLAPYAVNSSDSTAGTATDAATDSVSGALNTLSKADFYTTGLSGSDNSAAKRDELAVLLELPRGLSANALLAAINAVCTRDEFFAAVNSIGAIDGAVFDSGADGVLDSSADSNSDTDIETDTDTDTDTNSDTDSDTNSDTDSDTNSDTDSDTET